VTVSREGSRKAHDLGGDRVHWALTLDHGP
jgi:hypothetical protein